LNVRGEMKTPSPLLNGSANIESSHTMAAVRIRIPHQVRNREHRIGIQQGRESEGENESADVDQNPQGDGKVTCRGHQPFLPSLGGINQFGQ